MVSQNITQVQGGGLSAPTQDMNKEQYSSKKSTVAPTALLSTQSAGETSIDDVSSQKATSTPQNWAGKLPVFPFTLLNHFFTTHSSTSKPKLNIKLNVFKMQMTAHLANNHHG